MARTANMLMVFLLCFFLMADVSYGSSNVCQLSRVTGFCRGRFPRYYFNAQTERCELFYYGGCGGNGNNFGSIAECQEMCPRRIVFPGKRCCTDR